MEWFLECWMLVFFLLVCDFALALYFLSWKHTYTRKTKPDTRIQVVILPCSTLTYMCWYDVTNFQLASYYNIMIPKKWIKKIKTLPKVKNIRTFPPMFYMWPYKNISHFQVLITKTQFILRVKPIMRNLNIFWLVVWPYVINNILFIWGLMNLCVYKIIKAKK
jgi:hypothetical protein